MRKLVQYLTWNLFFALNVTASLCSKEDNSRDEACDAFKQLSRQCSDASCIEDLLKHLFQVFHGSEGKITVATHKMSILQVNIVTFKTFYSILFFVYLS